MSKSPFNTAENHYQFPENTEGRTYRFCRRCGFNKFFDEAIEVVNKSTVTEFKVRCTVCENAHLHWVSGTYDPYVGLETYEDEEKFEVELKNSFKASSGTVTASFVKTISEEDKIYKFFSMPRYKKVYNCCCGAHYTEFPSVHLTTCDAYFNH